MQKEGDLCIVVIQLEKIQEEGNKVVLSQVKPFYAIQFGDQTQHTCENFNGDIDQKQVFAFTMQYEKRITLKIFKTIHQGFYQKLDQLNLALESYFDQYDFTKDSEQNLYLSLELTEKEEKQQKKEACMTIKLTINLLQISKKFLNSYAPGQISWESIIRQKQSLLATTQEEDQKISEETKSKINKVIKKQKIKSVSRRNLNCYQDKKQQVQNQIEKN